MPDSTRRIKIRSARVLLLRDRLRPSLIMRVCLLRYILNLCQYTYYNGDAHQVLCEIIAVADMFVRKVKTILAIWLTLRGNASDMPVAMFVIRKAIADNNDTGSIERQRSVWFKRYQGET